MTRPDPDGSALRVEVLGPLRVLRGEDQIELTRASHRRLLSILALDANRRLGIDALIDRYWLDGAPATARAALHTHVSALRRLLPPDAIATEGSGYRLELSEAALDVNGFLMLAGEAQGEAAAREWTSALERAEHALALWRGPPYVELETDAFAQPEIARLVELHLELLELRAEALIALGRSADALPDLELLVVEHPLRERLWQSLMRARYRLGRHAEALAAYRAAWDALAELGLEPSAALRRLEQEILLHDATLAETARTNLPLELTTFVGREHEVAEALELLGEHRLLTMTGVGGSGKTRLAVRIAARSLASFPDGCWLVELAPLRDGDLVAAELAATIGLRVAGTDATAALGSALARDTALIILDNCEHLLDGAAAVTRALLEAGPHVRVLATSREALRVPGEVVLDVPPMPYPPADDGGADELEAFDAVQLFVERAALVQPSFALDASSGPAVAQICRRLDGIPLALELAAARVGSLSPETIAERLDDRFRILTGGSATAPDRHHTLRAAFDWSYDLLDARERLVFARLSVFRGSFELGAAIHVCTDADIAESDVVPLVAALVDKSLVSSFETGTGRRYRLLETLREYARERLEESGEADSARQRHAVWCVELARDITQRVYGPGRWELFARLDAESDNLQAALEDALAADSREDDVEALAYALAWHALDQGQLERCIERLETALEHGTHVEVEAECRALLGTALFLSGKGTEAVESSIRGAELAAALEPSARAVYVITTCARLHVLVVDLDPRDAIPWSERAVALAEESGDPFALILARRSLGRSLVWSGEADRGLEHYRSGLELALATGDHAIALETYESLFPLLRLHPVARRDEPKRAAEEMLGLFPTRDERWGRNTPADYLPSVFLQSGDWDRASEEIERMAHRHLEGWDRTAYLLALCSLRWMQGLLEVARAGLEELERQGVGARWHHERFPLLANVGADQGALEDVRAVADAHLRTQVHPAEEAMKLAVLWPLARAEVDAALATSGSVRDEHVQRARAAADRAQLLLGHFPPRTAGSLQMETQTTYLALARAELSRATTPDPEAWQDAVVRADHVYTRLYAQLRLAETFVATGRNEAAERALRSTHGEASRLGAGLLRAQLEAVASEAGVELSG